VVLLEEEQEQQEEEELEQKGMNFQGEDLLLQSITGEAGPQVIDIVQQPAERHQEKSPTTMKKTGVLLLTQLQQMRN